MHQLEMKESDDQEKDECSSAVSSDITFSWNTSQEVLLKGISERANCMRWLHNQCQLHFEYYNFYLTIPNVIISTLNGSFTMSLNSLFTSPESQKVATTMIGLISIFSAILTTLNQYVKSQQMMESHRAAGLSYSKLHRVITNELALRRDQRSNALDFLKSIRQEQDRLENTSPSILPKIIAKFNIQFASRQIEKPEIAGDLDETDVNRSVKISAMRVVNEIGKAIKQTINSVSVTPVLSDKENSPKTSISIRHVSGLYPIRSMATIQCNENKKESIVEELTRIITTDTDRSIPPTPPITELKGSNGPRGSSRPTN